MLSVGLEKRSQTAPKRRFVSFVVREKKLRVARTGP